MNRNLGGFTIVEVMIVLVVIGGLATFAAFTYHSSTSRTRDAQRQSDLRNYQNALEIYNTVNNTYPVQDTAAVDVTTLCTTLNMTTAECKTDPQSGVYRYRSDSNGLSYNLWVFLEGSTNYFILCSNGEAGFVTAEPPNGACPDF